MYLAVEVGLGGGVEMTREGWLLVGVAETQGQLHASCDQQGLPTQLLQSLDESAGELHLGALLTRIILVLFQAMVLFQANESRLSQS